MLLHMAVMTVSELNSAILNLLLVYCNWLTTRMLCNCVDVMLLRYECIAVWMPELDVNMQTNLNTCKLI